MKSVSLAVAALAMLSMLAGCAAKDHAVAVFICPDGQTLDLNSFPDHAEPGFNALSKCPVLPSMAILGLPAQLTAYTPGTFAWELRNGTYGTKGDPAHSMLSMIRLATSPVPDAELAGKGPEAYGKEVDGLKREHQNLPSERFTGALTLDTPGSYYVRGYMQVRAPGLANGTELNVWTSESKVTVMPVQPSGATHTATHSPGAAAGEFKADTATYALGDAVILDNQDALEHTFTFEGPGGATLPDVKVAMLAKSDPVALLKPGSWRIHVDETVPNQAKTLELTVTAPKAATA